jgi:hypothetical protein
MRGSTAAVMAGLAVWLGEVEARAAPDGPVSIALGYDTSHAETSCPDEASFRNLVAARLGYDPFAPQAPDRVDIEIIKNGNQLRGHASVQHAGTSISGGREIIGQPHECEALAAALATTVAIALDPVRAMSPTEALPPLPPAILRSPPPPVTSVPTPQSEAAPVRETPRASPPPAERLKLFGTAAGVASVAAAPSVTLGGEVGVGLSIRAFSLELMGRAEATPGATRVPSGDELEVTIFSAAVVPCANLSGFHACAFGRIGALQGYAPDVTVPTIQTSVFASAGVRAGYTVDLTRILSLRGDLEVGFPIVRTSLQIDGAPVWNASPVVGALSLGVVVRFF